MNNSKPHSFEPDGPQNVRTADEIAQAYRKKLNQRMPQFVTASEAESDEFAEETFTAVAGADIRSWHAMRENHIENAAQCNGKAQKLEEAIKSGEIPKLLSNQPKIPQGRFEKSKFFGFIAAGSLILLFEEPNLAWYLRFWTDSFGMALAYSFPLVSIALMEFAMLHHYNAFSDRAKRIIFKIQATVAVVAALCCVGVSIHCASESDVFNTSNPSPVSAQNLRMALQILSSIAAAGVFFQAAAGLMMTFGAPNPEYDKAVKEAENQRSFATQYYEFCAEINGMEVGLQAHKEAEKMSFLRALAILRGDKV